MKFPSIMLLLAAALVRNALPQIRPEVETRIVVETSPQAKVSLDGTPQGEVPRTGTFVIATAKPGPHELRVEAQGKRSFVQKVVVTAGQTVHVQAKLADFTGDLEVFTAAQAEVLLDGKPAGKADNSGRLLLRGLKVLRYTVRARGEGYGAEEQQIQLEPDVVTSVTIDLKRIQAGPPAPPLTFVKHRRLLAHAREVNQIRGLFFQPGGQLVSWSGKIATHDPETGRQTRSIEIDEGHYWLLSPDGRWVAFGYDYVPGGPHSAFLETEKAHNMWGQSGQVGIHAEIPGTPEVFSPDSKEVAIVLPTSESRKEGTAEIWDLQTHKLRTKLSDPTIHYLAFSPDGRWIATGGWASALWDADTGKKSHAFTSKDPGVRRLVFSDDSRWLAVVGDYRIELWEAATGRPGPLIDASGTNKPTFYDALFTHDGRYLISSMNPGIYIWDVATGRQVGNALEQTEGRLALSPDGRWLAVADNHDLVLWRRAD